MVVYVIGRVATVLAHVDFPPPFFESEVELNIMYLFLVDFERATLSEGTEATITLEWSHPFVRINQINQNI